MLAWILFGYSVSVFIIYALASDWWWRNYPKLQLKLWERVITAVFWPIILLVTALYLLVSLPILRLMWIFIATGLAFLLRALALLVLEPVKRRIFDLWSRWIESWPEPKRRLIRLFTMLVISYSLVAIAPLSLGCRMVAVTYWGIAGTVFVVMLAIRPRVKAKQANSS